ncbi:AAA family ATPase [bacterium]|nr:AAA family ATPase [bacterium]
MKIKDKLFWERFRPNTILPEKGKIPIILLPRIRKIAEKGIIMNMMFTGSGGLGKSTLAGILTKDTNCLKINCSGKDRGIDVVKEEMDDFCRNYSLIGKKGIKVIWLEEFDNATPDMRKALRGFMEDERIIDYVRFIATVNNLTKLQRTEEDLALLSRFNIIDFDPNSKEESDYIKKHQLSYLKSISKVVKFELSDDIFEKLILKSFPNFRKTVQLFQEISISGDIESYETMVDRRNNDVYEFIMNGKLDLNEIYYFVCDNYPKDKTEELILLLSRPFFKYLMDEHQDKIAPIGQQMIQLSKEYNSQYTQTTDPEIHLINYVIKLKQLFV